MDTVFACFVNFNIDEFDRDCREDHFELGVCVFSTLEKARLALEEHLNSMNIEDNIEVKLIPLFGEKQWNVINEWKFEELNEEGDSISGEIWIIRELKVK